MTFRSAQEDLSCNCPEDALEDYLKKSGTEMKKQTKKEN
jgi:hypothetical protein